MAKTLTPHNLAVRNRKAIIELLRNQGPLSKADISRTLKMSFPAVSSNVNYLIENNYIKEIGEGNNAMGRKSTLLEFNARYGYVIGIDLGRSLIRLKISDLLGNSLVTLTSGVERQENGNNLIHQLNKLIEDAIKKCNIKKSDIMCVGVGTPGILDKESGNISLMPYTTGWDNINIIEMFERKFDCPVVIQNSVNLGAVGEMWRGCGRNYQNLVYIDYSIGIGGALIINGNLFTGTNGAAGEIAFAAVAPEFIREEYTVEGSLEQFISGNSIDTYIRDLGIGANSLKELYEMNTPEAIKERDSIVNKIEKYFGVVLINISSFLNPEALILSGGIGINVGKLLIPKWNKMLRANLPFVPDLICSQMGSEVNVYGAVRYALENISDIYCSWA
jgi:predicted NBD/HSP70 family sugar kinase